MMVSAMDKSAIVFVAQMVVSMVNAAVTMEKPKIMEKAILFISLP